jgi:XisH protein
LVVFKNPKSGFVFIFCKKIKTNRPLFFCQAKVRLFNLTTLLFTRYLALQEQIKTWDLYIAISDIGYKKLDDSPIFQKAIKLCQLQFLIINPITQRVIEWKK